MKSSSDPSAKPVDATNTQPALGASVQVLPLPQGFYMFSVVASPGTVDTTTSRLQLPAVHVAVAPGVSATGVEFMGGSRSNGTWLFAKGELLLVRVTDPAAVLILTSVRTPGEDALAIRIEKLGSEIALSGSTLIAETDGRLLTRGGNSPALAADDAAPPAVTGGQLNLQISTHIRTRGDTTFTGSGWAGRLGPGLWIEAFSITPLEGLSAHDIEYKGLTSSGFETPWLSAGASCGTRGMSVPLIGFAVRLKPGPNTAEYDCEYSGTFQSGATVGPMRLGAPCRSTMNSDPLEGMSVRISRKKTSSILSGASSAELQPTPVKPSTGPSFGKVREEAVAVKAEPTRPSTAARLTQNLVGNRGKPKK